jgi:twitching motility protein PilT
MIRIEDLLNEMVEKRASDMFLKAGQRPCLRIDGEIMAMDFSELEVETVESIVLEIMSDEQAKQFSVNPEMDLSIGVRGLGRFRINVYRQRNSVAAVFRFVTAPPTSFSSLNLPDKVEELAELTRGMVLVTGTTGSGKSTTLAAMIHHINERRRCHIVTIEDPIEFIHGDRKAIISQREVGFDTNDFREALKRVMRQSPDVILIGEMRDVETIQTAVAAAETGHLVLSTLHTIDAVQTVERIINYFPAYLHQQIRMELSLCLKGVICQRLLPMASGTGRLPAVELMISTPLIRKLLFEGRTTELPQHIAAGREEGMQTFNQALAAMYQSKKVSKDDAMSFATSPDELRLMLEGVLSGSASAAGNYAM